MKAFPGGKSTQFIYYVRPTLDDFHYDAAIIHARINDIYCVKSIQMRSFCGLYLPVFGPQNLCI